MYFFSVKNLFIYPILTFPSPSHHHNQVNELKLERDKWVSFSQQESSRATELSTQLDSERRTSEALREVLAELRQHHRHNGLDTSQLECDDLDASVHSFGNNVCKY